MKALRPAPVFLLLLLPACSAAVKERRPDWLSGPSPAYPRAAYLTGVGEASTPEKAADRARAELAKALSLSVSAESSSKASETSNGKSSSYSEEASDEVRTSTQKVLDGVEIAESWTAEDGTHYALAVLNRARALSILQDKIEDMDKSFIERSGELGQAGGKFARLRLSLRLVGLARARRKLNEDYRSLNPEGKSLPAPAETNDALSQARRAISAISVRVRATGDGAEQVASRIIDGLGALGLKIVAAANLPADIVIESQASARALAPENLTWYWAKGTILSKMSYGDSGEEFTRFEESGQEATGDPGTAVEATLLALSDKTAMHAFKVVASSDIPEQ